MLLASLFGLIYIGAFGKMYTEQELADFENHYGSVVLSADNVTLGHIFNVNRSETSFDELPPQVIRALISTEDIRFYEHDGVDIRSLLRVLTRTIILGDRSGGGGSTITQQLAKNMYGRENHGFLTIPVNKLKEMILARRLERVYSKEEILGRYLNTVSFGENTFGIAAATKRYFNKSLQELQVEEAATLIGMLKATTTYNPRLHPENATARRNVVLSQMEKYEYLDHETADSLRNKPLVLDYTPQSDQGIANYFIKQVKRKAQKILDELQTNEEKDKPWSLEEDGLIIETTLNARIQSFAVQSLHNHLKSIQPQLNRQYQSGSYRQQLDSIVGSQLKKLDFDIKTDTARIRNIFSWGPPTAMSAADSISMALLQIHAGILALDPRNGAVLAYVGGIDFISNPYDQVRAKRHLASAFKPVLYAAALKNGKHPCDYIDNEPFTLTDFEDWQPTNYNEESGGKYSLAAALALSKNIPSIRLLFETGFESVNEVWNALGFSSPFVETPSVALGSIDASLLELVTGYSVFANGGHLPDPFMIKQITTREGKVLYEHEIPESEQVLETEVSYQISAMLKKAVNEGTGSSLRSKFGLNIPLAGKTGTSQNFADAWFIGYNPKIIMAARVGASLPVIHFESGTYGAGSTLALPIVGNILKQAQKDPKTYSLVNGAFPFESSADYLIDCEDFMEATGFEKIINVFKSENTTLEKEQKKAQRKGFFKRLFGN